MVHGGAANRGWGNGARIANVVDAYNHDDASRDATTKERFQRLEQLQETVLAQFVALQVVRQPHHHPRNHALEEEVFDDKAFNPFGDYQPKERGNGDLFQTTGILIGRLS